MAPELAEAAPQEGQCLFVDGWVEVPSDATDMVSSLAVLIPSICSCWLLSINFIVAISLVMVSKAASVLPILESICSARVENPFAIWTCCSFRVVLMPWKPSYRVDTALMTVDIWAENSAFAMVARGDKASD